MRLWLLRGPQQMAWNRWWWRVFEISSSEIMVLMCLCNLCHTILQFLNLPHRVTIDHVPELISSKNGEVATNICSRAWQHNVFVPGRSQSDNCIFPVTLCS
jgi:hypothetical protein